MQLISSKSPIQLMMIKKNDTEISGYRSAMHKDGVAMVKFLRWLTTGHWAKGPDGWTMNGALLWTLPWKRPMVCSRLLMLYAPMAYLP